jgi:hypothetical protein
MTRTVQINRQSFDLDSENIARTMSRVLPEPIQMHYVVIGGRRFPPKQVIAAVTGLDRADFTTHQARRVLRGLGFGAARRGRRRASPADGSSSGEKERSSVERLRPHIGQWVAVKNEEVLVGAPTPAEVIAWLSRHDLRADSVFRVPEDEQAAGGAAPA